MSDRERNADNGQFVPRTPKVAGDEDTRDERDEHAPTQAAEVREPDPEPGSDIRVSRDQEVRDAEHFYDDDDFDESWLGRLNLDAPVAREGFVQRWVATRVMGEDLPVNATRQHRQGWRPRLPSTIPQGFYPSTEMNDGKGVIGYAGLILMERPKALHERARKANRDEIRRRTESIETDLRREESPGNPFMVNRRSQVETRRPPVQEE